MSWKMNSQPAERSSSISTLSPGTPRELLRDGVGRGADTWFWQFGERSLDPGTIEPDHGSRTFVGIEVQAFAIWLGVEDVAEQQTLERRDVGNWNCRLDDGRGKIVSHGRNLREAGRVCRILIRSRTRQALSYPAGFTLFPAV